MTTPILVLDAGHGLTTAGKQTMNGKYGIMKEWELNNKVLSYLTEYLNDYVVTIYRTDDPTGKTDVDLLERVKRCNAYGPVLFISIHHNAGGGTGIEVYWHTKGTKEDEKIAKIVAPKLSAQTGMKNRGVKQEAFTVLTCKATAILVEGGFMDTQSDYEYICSEAGQRAYAKAVADSVIEYLSLKKKATTSTAPVQTTSVKWIEGEWKIKVLVDTNLWLDTNYQNVGGRVAKDEELYVTKMTECGGFFLVDGKYLANSHTLNCVTNMWLKPQGKIQLKQDCNLWSYANYDVVVGQVKAWEIYEYIAYKNGMYQIPYKGWVSESFINKKLSLTDAQVTV